MTIKDNSFQVTIPADILVDKINNYNMVLWVNVDTENNYLGLYTEEEKEKIIEDKTYSKEPLYWKKVELTLEQLMNEH